MNFTGLAAGLMVIGLFAGACGPVGAVELDQRHAVLAPPVNSAPRWYVVQNPNNSEQPVEVRSLTSGRPLGYVPPGYRFLAFGANRSLVTMAFGGQVGYIPSVSAAELFPVVARPMEWKAAGPTLEEQAEIARQQAREAQAKGLEPLSLKRRAEERLAAEQAAQMGQAGAQGNLPLIGGEGREMAF